jgi:hypothetical protein
LAIPRFYRVTLGLIPMILFESPFLFLFLVADCALRWRAAV